MNKSYTHHLEEALPEAPPATGTAAVRNVYTRRVARQQEVAYLMLQQAEQELFETVKAFHACKQEKGQSVSTYVLMMKAYLDQMEQLGYPMPLVLGVNLILNSLSKDYDQFVQNYNMHDMGKTIPKLHAMLKLAEKSIPKKALTVLAIKQDWILEEELSSIFGIVEEEQSQHVWHIRGYQKLIKRALDMYVGNDNSATVEAIGSFDLILPSGMILIDMHNHISNEHSIYTCSNKKSKHNLDSTFLWHCRLGHINKKRIEKLQHDGLLESIDDESFDVCVSCISSKMARNPFTHASERADDLLRVIHSDVCGPFRTTSREGYALESAARILNMFPTKKALVKRDMPNKLESRSIKCIFVGDPKETMGYYFYYTLENKNYVARYAEFFKTSLITQEASGSTVDFDEIQRQYAQPSENTIQHQHEIEHDVVDPQTDVIPVRRSARISQAPERYGFYIDAEEHEVDYEETFSPVADKKGIRILIAIAAYYDYKIWQMDVKTAFLNGRLNEDVYMVQPEGFMNPKHPRRVCKLQRSIYRLKQASRSWNKRFDEEIKKYGFTQNPNEPCVYKRASGSIIVFLILYVDDILLMGNNIPMLQDVKSWLGKCFAMKDLELCVLVYGGDSTTELGVTCYTDASWETDRDDLRSQTGFIFVMNGGAVDWKVLSKALRNVFYGS
ncbi:retrotransposon protein, putative, ty1-copia subclass [Tanacetum coccineum]